MPAKPVRDPEIELFVDHPFQNPLRAVGFDCDTDTRPIFQKLCDNGWQVAGGESRQASDSDMACLALGYTLADLANLSHQIKNPLNVGLQEPDLLGRGKLPAASVKQWKSQSLPKISK
jgi:hypothetical protein